MSKRNRKKKKKIRYNPLVIPIEDLPVLYVGEYGYNMLRKVFKEECEKLKLI